MPFTMIKIKSALVAGGVPTAPPQQVYSGDLRVQAGACASLSAGARSLGRRQFAPSPPPPLCPTSHPTSAPTPTYCPWPQT